MTTKILPLSLLFALLLAVFFQSSESFIPSSSAPNVRGSSTPRKILEMSTDPDKDAEEINRFRSEVLNLRDEVAPSSPRASIAKGLQFGGLAFLGLAVLQNGGLPSPLAAKGLYPLEGDESLMKAKAHGTTDQPVQKSLRFACDERLADRICSFNRRWAENAGIHSHVLENLFALVYTDEVIVIVVFRLLDQHEFLI